MTYFIYYMDIPLILLCTVSEWNMLIDYLSVPVLPKQAILLDDLNFEIRWIHFVNFEKYFVKMIEISIRSHEHQTK